MKIIVLGSGAGGGIPQWNCNSDHCRLARELSPAIKSRTQSSLAVSADGERYVLLNCSPDVRHQINDNPQMHPREGKRSTPIKAVVLTNGDVDHVAGLLTMRESEAFRLYASTRVLSVIDENSIFNVLNPELVKREPLELSKAFRPLGPDGNELGLTVEAFAVPGKVALYKEDASKGADFGTEEGDTISLRITDDNGQSFFYIPGCARLDDKLKERLRGAGLLFFDGTLFRDDEMVTAGLGAKTGKRMGHMNMDGEDGSLAAFADMGIDRKIYIHINNSNPVLLEDSPERRQVTAAGWEVAEDGQQIEL